MENLKNRIIMNEKKPLFLIISIALFVKVALTLIFTILIAIFSKTNIGNVVLVSYNGAYLLAAEVLLALALLTIYLGKDKTKTIKAKINKKDKSIIKEESTKLIPYDVDGCSKIRIASMVLLIGTNVITIIILFFCIIYFLKLVLTISGDNAKDFFVSVLQLILVLVVVVISLGCIYSFYGAINRYGHHRKHVILNDIKENKTYYTSIAYTLFVLAGFVVIGSLLLWLLSGNEFVNTYVNIFFNNKVALAGFGGTAGIMLFVSSLLSAVVYVLVGVLMLLIKKQKKEQ